MLTHGTRLTLDAEIAGLGGTVRSIRPIFQYTHFIPMQKGRNSLAFNFQGSFLTGYGGVVAPPFERNYMGGEYDIRGFDIRSISPIAYLPNKGPSRCRIPMARQFPRIPAILCSATTRFPFPSRRLSSRAGMPVWSAQFEYHITIAGPVVLAPFVDAGSIPLSGNRS